MFALPHPGYGPVRRGNLIAVALLMLRRILAALSWHERCSCEFLMTINRCRIANVGT